MPPVFHLPGPFFVRLVFLTCVLVFVPVFVVFVSFSHCHIVIIIGSFSLARVRFVRDELLSLYTVNTVILSFAILCHHCRHHRLVFLASRPLRACRDF